MIILNRLNKKHLKKLINVNQNSLQAPFKSINILFAKDNELNLSFQ